MAHSELGKLVKLMGSAKAVTDIYSHPSVGSSGYMMRVKIQQWSQGKAPTKSLIEDGLAREESGSGAVPSVSVVIFEMDLTKEAFKRVKPKHIANSDDGAGVKLEMDLPKTEVKTLTSDPLYYQCLIDPLSAAAKTLQAQLEKELKAADDAIEAAKKSGDKAAYQKALTDEIDKVAVSWAVAEDRLNQQMGRIFQTGWLELQKNHQQLKSWESRFRWNVAISSIKLIFGVVGAASSNPITAVAGIWTIYRQVQELGSMIEKQYEDLSESFGEALENWEAVVGPVLDKKPEWDADNYAADAAETVAIWIFGKSDAASPKNLLKSCQQCEGKAAKTFLDSSKLSKQLSNLLGATTAVQVIMDNPEEYGLAVTESKKLKGMLTKFQDQIRELISQITSSMAEVHDVKLFLSFAMKPAQELMNKRPKILKVFEYTLTVAEFVATCGLVNIKAGQYVLETPPALATMKTIGDEVCASMTAMSLATA